MMTSKALSSVIWLGIFLGCSGFASGPKVNHSPAPSPSTSAAIEEEKLQALPPSSDAVDVPCPASQPSKEESEKRIAVLKTTIQHAMETTSPHQDNSMNMEPHGTDVVFTGNYDWHSAVHAHWALLSMARVTGDDELRDLILNRLTPEVIQHESALLKEDENKSFEMPYGQSWLLMLLSEVSKTSIGSRPDIIKFHDETLKRVMDYLEAQQFPEHPEADEGYHFEGDHGSWLMSFLLVQLSEKDPKIQSRLDKLRRSKIEPSRSLIGTNRVNALDFLYLPAVLACIDETSGDPAHSSLVYPVSADPDFESPLSMNNAHLPGQLLVRNWPHAIQSSQNPASCSRYNTRLTEFFSRPDQWQTDFKDATHWVPQFMWMSIWLEMGRP